MDKQILDLIANFSVWKGDTYRLAMLIVEEQKKIDKQKLVDAGMQEASEIL